MPSPGTKFISTAVFTSQLSTLKSAMHATFQVRHFYRFLLSKHHLFDMHNHNNLISRVKETCNSNNISFLRYLFDGKYVFHCKRTLTTFQCDGIIDSIKYEFGKPYPDYHLIKLLLKHFKLYVTLSHIFYLM